MRSQEKKRREEERTFALKLVKTQEESKKPDGEERQIGQKVTSKEAFGEEMADMKEIKAEDKADSEVKEVEKQD